MLRIVMDTAGDLPEGWQKDFQIELIPINIIHEGKNYLQGIDLGYEDFYRLVESSDSIPSTSQPTPFQFTEFYRRIASPGDTILSIHVTEKLSGTMSSARTAAEELKDEINVIPFDSASGALSMGMMAKEGRIMDNQGKTIEEILERLVFIREHMELVFTVDDLKYARLSGRIKYFQAALASLLNVKPIIELKDGVIEMGEKVRSRAQSIEMLIKKMRQKFGDQRVNIGVVHAHDKEAGMQLLSKVVENFNCAELVLAEISISLAVHFGPGALGIVGYPLN